MPKDRITKKDKLKLELDKVKVKYFSKDSTAVLAERLAAHNEKRKFVQPPKGKAPQTGGSKKPKTSPAPEVAPAPVGYKHSNGKTYSFKAGRKQIILLGQDYSCEEALANADVMDELIERKHPGLTWV